MRNPALWKRNVQKTRRQSGKSFLSRKNKVILEKNVKAPCTNCIFHCVNIFSDEERNNIFQSFWSLSDDDKNSFYNTFFTRHYAKHRKKNSASYIKKFSYRYYLEKNQTLYRVCRTFFLNTLNIDQKRIYYNFKHLKNNLIGSPLPRKKKGKHVKFVTPPNKMSEVREHISSFPAIESHYCRANTNKKYIESSLNLSKMYNLYIQKYENPVSINVYRKVFNNEFNISFHQKKGSV